MSVWQVLVVDDDPEQRSDLAEMVAACGYSVASAADGREALAKTASAPIGAIITDLVMPRMDGFALLKEMAARGDRIPTIVLTACGGIDNAISVVHDLKAFWFLEKPVQHGVLRTLLERALEQRHMIEETDRLQRQLSYSGVLGELIGESPCMQSIFSVLRQVAPTTASVLITGESGTGKELVARAIHSLSPRSAGPFVAVNCAALPESLMESELFGHEKGSFTGADRRRIGKFEQCNGGTLFLDEVGDMPPGLQAKVLRLLQEQAFERVGGNETVRTDVRLMAATHRNLKAWSEEGKFRPDLYYRLGVFTIHLPPLRQRGDDLPMLVQHFLRRFSRELGRETREVTAEAMERLRAYTWPGNIRELQSVLKQALLRSTGPALVPTFLPDLAPRKAIEPATELSAGSQLEALIEQRLRDGSQDLYEEARRDLDRFLLPLVLRSTGGNQLRAARILGIARRTLRLRLRELGLSVTKSVEEDEDDALAPE